MSVQIVLIFHSGNSADRRVFPGKIGFGRLGMEVQARLGPRVRLLGRDELEPISKLLEQHGDRCELHKAQEVRGVVFPANQ